MFVEGKLSIQERIFSQDLASAWRSATVEVTPARGWQSFFVDLWNHLEGPGLMGMKKKEGLGDSDLLRLEASGTAVELNREMTRELLNCARSDHRESGRIRLTDGMLCLMKHQVAHVVAVEEDLSFPGEDWIDVVVAALQWAAWQGASPERMRNALAQCCWGEGRLNLIEELGSVRFLDGHAFRNNEDVARVLRWIDEPVLVVLRNDEPHNEAIAKALSEKEMTAIRWIDASSRKRGSEQHGENMFTVRSVREGVNRALEFAEEESTVLCFIGLGCSEEGATREAIRWKKEVARR